VEKTSKRRRGADTEAHVKRGLRVVGDGKVLVEKLGRKDPCPCGSGRRFQAVLHANRSVSTASCATITAVTEAR
jgi:uncharacterized protein YecA (UPF0149 family)